MSPVKTPTGFVSTTDLNVIRDHQEQQFHVKLEKGNVRILNHQEFLKEDDAYEFQVRRKGIPVVATGYPTWVTPGSGARIKGGYLHAIDNGEWGGGIYFEPANLRKLKKISSNRTHIVESLPQGIFAIQTKGTMVEDYMYLLELTKTQTGWKERFVVDLHEHDGTSIRVKDAFVLGTDQRVIMVFPSGKQTELFRAPNYYLCPRSCVLQPNGELWFGCSWGVLCLKPETHLKYKPFLFVPTKTS